VCPAANSPGFFMGFYRRLWPIFSPFLSFTLVASQSQVVAAAIDFKMQASD